MPKKKTKTQSRRPLLRKSKAKLGSVAGTAPRYLQLAQQFIAGIAAGDYPVGSQLPTEVEIYQKLGISRFTVREAFRVLLDRGLVARRQRVGTTVISTPDESRYTLSLSSLRDLLQYAQHTELQLSNIGRITPDHERARDLGLTPGEDWIYACGIRHDTQTSLPYCVTRVYVTPALPGIGSKLRKRRTAVYTMLEKEYGILIKRVEQELQGVTFDEEDAAKLNVAPGHPGLRIIRRYFDAKSRLIEVADSIHPSDRFSYRMQLTR